MKLQINTFTKTVTIEEKVNINELMTALNKLLGDDIKDWSIESAQITQWTYPIIIRDYPTYPHYPPYPWITYQGIYNVQY